VAPILCLAHALVDADRVRLILLLQSASVASARASGSVILDEMRTVAAWLR
jgi:hypothetical protein